MATHGLETLPTYIVSASARLAAPPDRVYAIIANYHTGHPSILPKQFSDMKVERGGIGEGTVVTFKVTALGRTDSFRAEVSEPEPGRVLVERNVAGLIGLTTFIVEPGATGRESNVTIHTEMPVRPGFVAAIERFVTVRVLRPMYAEELRLLEARAADPARTGAPVTARA